MKGRCEWTHGRNRPLRLLTEGGRKGGRERGEAVPDLPPRHRRKNHAIAGQHPLQASGDVVSFDGDEVAVLELLGLGEGGFEENRPVGEALV